MSDHNHDHSGEPRVLTLREIFRIWLDKKLPKYSRESKRAVANIGGPPKAPDGIDINTIAIVLDGRVEEVIRAQNRLAALLLSEPEFVQFDPSVERPTIGWFYENGKFVNPDITISQEKNLNEKEKDNF